MANRKYVHIVQRDTGWGTLREGGQRATEVFETQAQAIQAGRHKPDGRWRARARASC